MQEEDCAMCKVIVEEAATKTLPLEIKEVFAEVAAAREKGDEDFQKENENKQFISLHIIKY